MWAMDLLIQYRKNIRDLDCKTWHGLATIYRIGFV